MKTIFVIFFFQAEDGIRYLTVTGVQTCALPISDTSRALHLIRRIRNSFAHEVSGAKLDSGPHRDRIRELAAPFVKTYTYRSEERRVGKECKTRSLWYQYKK